MIALALVAWVAANDVDLVVGSDKHPGEKPTLTLKIKKDLKSATLDVKSDAGHAHQTLGPKEGGGELTFNLPQERPGTVTWLGTLAVEFGDGSAGSMPLKFQTRVLSGFKFQVKDVKLDEHQATFVSEHDTAQVDLEVYGDDGVNIANTSQAFDSAKAGTPLTVKWTPLADGPVLRIHAVIHDTATATQSSDSFPYNISIPHDEVVFDTNKSDIRSDQEPKLSAALPEMEKAIKRYGEAIKVTGASIKLFVSGFTDTVGSSSSNRALSDRRAQSIAQWFKKKGVPVSIYARGFGEDILKVQTPDETAEEKNRRADYDVGVNGPTGSTDGWTRVN
jgi:outer membrane protein OmpA-like peptidoglycan-associated protein